MVKKEVYHSPHAPDILCEITGLLLHRDTKEAEGFHGNPRLGFFFFHLLTVHLTGSLFCGNTMNAGKVVRDLSTL